MQLNRIQAEAFKLYLDQGMTKAGYNSRVYDRDERSKPTLTIYSLERNPAFDTAPLLIDDGGTIGQLKVVVYDPQENNTVDDFVADLLHEGFEISPVLYFLAQRKKISLRGPDELITKNIYSIKII